MIHTDLGRLLKPEDAPPPVPSTFALAPLAKGPLETPVAKLANLYSQESVSQDEIFSWPTMVDEPFLSLVEADDQAAMVVAYYFYNLLRQVEHQIWWTGNYGRTECERLLGMIALEYRHFLPAEITEEPTY